MRYAVRIRPTDGDSARCLQLEAETLKGAARIARIFHANDRRSKRHLAHPVRARRRLPRAGLSPLLVAPCDRGQYERDERDRGQHLDEGSNSRLEDTHVDRAEEQAACRTGNCGVGVAVEKRFSESRTARLGYALPVPRSTDALDRRNGQRELGGGLRRLRGAGGDAPQRRPSEEETADRGQRGDLVTRACRRNADTDVGHGLQRLFATARVDVRELRAEEEDLRRV